VPHREDKDRILFNIAQEPVLTDPEAPFTATGIVESLRKLQRLLLGTIELQFLQDSLLSVSLQAGKLTERGVREAKRHWRGALGKL
jgi:hypothetical protein